MAKLLLLGAMATCLCMSAMEPGQVDFSAKSWTVPHDNKTINVRKNANHVNATAGTKKRTVSSNGSGYMAALQTFYDADYNFTLTCGLANVYPISVKKTDGSSVVISNILNYDDETQSSYGYKSQDVTGTYDADTHTITIPTPHDNGNEATIIGTDDYYGYALMAGRMDENYEFWPEDNLTFHVVGDFERIYTTQHIGVVSVLDGETGYLQGAYASLMAQPTDSPSPLVALPSEVDLGKTYPENELNGHLQLLNLGAEVITFALSLPADSYGLSINPALGEIQSGTSLIVNAKYSASAPGTFSLPVILAYETTQGESEMNVNFVGEVESFPDFSPIIKTGDMSFATCYDHPFVIKESGGYQYAVSTANQYYDTSWLEVRISVPENQIGKLSYKGEAKCTDPDNAWAGHNVSIYVDESDEPAYSTYEDADIDSSIVMEPGDHKLRFEFRMGMNYDVTNEYWLRLSELALTTESVGAQGVELLTPSIDFGGSLLDGISVSKTVYVNLRNTGSTPLKVTGFQSSDPAFTAELPAQEASLMGTLSVPVTLTATEARIYESDLTIETTAGAVTAKAMALVRQLPDFSGILEDKAGVITVTTDAGHPFLMSQDGTKAYNANAGETDDTAETSVITFNITVPETKIAYISWDAEISSDESDRTCVNIDGMDYAWVKGVQDSGSETLFQYYPSALDMVPGSHTVTFSFIKNGDGVIGGKDMFSISRFSAAVDDFDPRAAELNRTEIRFADCIISSEGPNVNKTNTTVCLYNMGSDELRVLSEDESDDNYTDSRPFSYKDPGYVAYHGQSLMVDLVFFPSEEGTFKNTITIPTTFGNYTVEAEGHAYTAEGLFLMEDMNDGATRWTLIDKDGDGNNWFKVSDEYLYRPDLQCFSGADALMSYSMKDNECLTPDNYAVSPEFAVPADGGMLSWWVAPVNAEAAAESYEVCVIPANDYHENKLGSYPVAYSETLKPECLYYKQSVLDLSAYAGQKVRLGFRHNTLDAQSGILLEDVYGYTNDKWSQVTANVGDITCDTEVLRVEYFDLTGIRVNGNAKGIILKRSYLKDGSVKAEKLIK